MTDHSWVSAVSHPAPAPLAEMAGSTVIVYTTGDTVAGPLNEIHCSQPGQPVLLAVGSVVVNWDHVIKVFRAP